MEYNTIDLTQIYEASDLILNFLNITNTGNSFWFDHKGRKHSADIGYVIEFLKDLKQYSMEDGKDV